jgi:hypothetical protein
MVQNEGKVAVPRLRTTPVHGSILVRDAHSVPVLPEHIDLFNEYLEFGFREKLLPMRDGFYKSCMDYHRSLGRRPPVIASTPDAFTVPPRPTAGAAVLDSDIFWRKLFAEQYRRDHPWIPYPSKLDLGNSLWVAVVVLESGSRGHNDGYYWSGSRPSHYHDMDDIVYTGPADHEMAIETCRGFLQIRRNLNGLYFRMVLTDGEADGARAPDNAED